MRRSDYFTVKGKAPQTAMQGMPDRRTTGASPVPEHWVAERILHGHLAGAATLLQAQYGDRGSTGQPEFGVFGVPLPTADGDFVISRIAPPSAVTAALGVDLADVPSAIAAAPVARSCERLTAAGLAAVRACPDPSELAGDPWAATLLQHDHCAFVRPPWTVTA